MHQVVIVGAGPSGVAAAVSLRDRGVRPVLIDRAGEVGASWRGRYDRLKLNTGRDYSHLPDRPYPQGTPAYPSRVDVVEHLHRHAHEDGIELQLATEVHRIDKHDGASVSLHGGPEIKPDVVISATGYRRGLEPLVGHLDVLDECGVPRAAGAVAAAEGLRFIGFFCRPALIGFVAEQSGLFANSIATELQQSTNASTQPV
ncbi:NAD(P)-binding domain-containing protein [Mycobacterium sp.]|uniref:NAD(P)-binding domain-containing protein n=1 Tax=Mycobacterium sp. TaxID=1785 RepID=UPI003D09FC33